MLYNLMHLVRQYQVQVLGWGVGHSLALFAGERRHGQLTLTKVCSSLASGSTMEMHRYIAIAPPKKATMQAEGLAFLVDLWLVIRIALFVRLRDMKLCTQTQEISVCEPTS